MKTKQNSLAAISLNVVDSNPTNKASLQNTWNTFFTLVFILIGLFILSSCNKEEFADADQIQEKILKEDILTGEEIEATIQEEGQHARTMEGAGNPKLKDLNFEAQFLIPESEMHKRSRYYYPLYCGYYNNGSTYAETNTASYYPGPDRIYYFTLTSRKRVNIQLTNQSADHDLLLAHRKIDSRGRWRLGSTIITSLNSGRDDEFIDLVLSAGTYFIVVDTYGGARGSFRVRLNCTTANYSSSCENYDNLYTSYSDGISYQSRLWKKWSSAANDGKVLAESYDKITNYVVKFDHARFGYQDAVRSLTNYHIIGGVYEMEFDMFVPFGKKAEFVSEKLSRFGRYGAQGFHVKLEYGRIFVTHNGQIALARASYPLDRWFKIKILFDMNNDRIYLRIDQNSLFLLSASAAADTSPRLQRSIWGIDFYGDSRNSFFHVDNVCVKRHTSSSNPGVVSADEIINLIP